MPSALILRPLRPVRRAFQRLGRQLLPQVRNMLRRATRIRLLEPIAPVPAERLQLAAGQHASRWCQAGSALWVADGRVRLHLPPGDALALAGPLVLHTGQSLVLPRTGWVRVEAPQGARLHWLPWI